MNDIVVAHLRRLVEQHGVALSADSPRLRALLMDACGSHKLEVNAVITVADEGVAHKLYSALNNPGGVTVFLMSQAVRRLEEDSGLAHDMAQWAVESWLEALQDAGLSAHSAAANATNAPSSAATIQGRNHSHHAPSPTNGRLCSDIHGDSQDCAQEIPPGRTWKFCPLCGRATGHIAPAFGSPTVLEIPYQQNVTRLLTLRNAGVNEVHVQTELLSTKSGVQFSAGVANNFAITPKGSYQIRVDVPPLQRSGTLGELVLLTRDAPLDPQGDPWQERVPRRCTFRLEGRVEKPADVRVLQEFALFREGVSDREITLINEGDTALRIKSLTIPDGYKLVSAELESVSGAAGRDGNAPDTFKIRRQWTQKVSDEADVVIEMEDGSFHRVTLFSLPTRGGGGLLQAIIGVDFGTAFTSVAFRECRHSKKVSDSVDFLKPLGEVEDRFQTRVWIGRNREMAFASQATKQYYADPSAGFLFREIKTLLRDDSQEAVHPLQDKQEAQRLLEGHYGADWREYLVVEYLTWLYRSLIRPEIKTRFDGPDANIRYVFSLPVLDYASDKTQYDQQRQRMEKCVRAAGFPMQAISWEFEPVCAVIGLMNPPSITAQNAQGWPRLGSAELPLKSGDAIAVFDSGGGTTDVVLAIAEVGGANSSEPGGVGLRVEKCLGVGSSSETFGGEAVTTQLLEALRQPNSVSYKGWYSGAINIDTVLGVIGSQSDSRNAAGTNFTLEQRDRAEELKIDLGARHKQVVRGDVTFDQSLLWVMVSEALDSLGKELSRSVFTTQSPKYTAYYLCVGGNTSLAPVERYVEKFMQDPTVTERRLRVPESYRKLAVAYGAVWVPDAHIRNAAPYDLEVLMGGEKLLSVERDTPQQVYPRSHPHIIPPGETVELEVRARLDAQWRRLTAQTICNPYEDTSALVKLRTDLQNGTLRIQGTISNPEAEDDGGSVDKPLLEYVV